MSDEVLIVELDDTIVVEDQVTELAAVNEHEVLVVEQVEAEFLAVDGHEVLVYSDCGVQGPPGPPGPPGGTYYVHTQSTPSAGWVVNHNLGRLAHVTVFVPDFVEVEADVVHNTVNQVAITFASPHAGSAYIA